MMTLLAGVSDCNECSPLHVRRNTKLRCVASHVEPFVEFASSGEGSGTRVRPVGIAARLVASGESLAGDCKYDADIA
jgi:hypothetical protein